MDTMKLYNEIMESSELIALATNGQGHPNVRVVNFVVDKNDPGKVYFATFKNNQKVKEIERDNSVAFTTVPPTDAPHTKVTNCKAVPSELTIFDLEEAFVSKIPSYKEIIQAAGPALAVYELQFKEATVTADFQNIYKVSF